MRVAIHHTAKTPTHLTIYITDRSFPILPPINLNQSQTRAALPIKPTAEAEADEGGAFLLPNIAEIVSDLKALGEGVVEEVIVVGC